MDRGKEIDEMVDYIDNYIEQVNVNHWYSNELSDGLAKYLYNSGYRKIVKTDWLTKGISKEQLEKEKDESLKEFFERNCKKYGYCKQSEIERLQKDKSEWMHLPCKVGDMVYCFEPCFDKHYNQRLKIVEEKIVDIKTIATVFGLNFEVDKIGKTVFLTREEAEKALKEELKNESI